MSKKSNMTKMERLVISKWFYYFWIAIFLAFIFCTIWISAYSYSNDFAIRFMPTLIGLVFNFAIFIVFFDLREYLEWKTVRDKIMRRIGDQLHSILWDVALLLDAEIDTTMSDITEVDFNKLSKKYLNAMASGNFKLTNVWKDKEINSKLANMFLLKENMLGEIEGRYGKFLKSDIQCSLMNVEEYLHNLSWDFTLTTILENHKPDKIPDLIHKIGQEIDYLNKSGIKVF